MTNTRDSVLTLIKNRTKKRVEYTTNSAVLFTIKIRGVWYKSSSKMIRNNKRKDAKTEKFSVFIRYPVNTAGSTFPFVFWNISEFDNSVIYWNFQEKSVIFPQKNQAASRNITWRNVYILSHYIVSLTSSLNSNTNHKPNIPRIQNWKHLYVKLVGKCIDSLKRLIVTLSRRKGWCYDYEWWWLCMWDKRWKRFTFYVIQILIIRLLVNNIINILNPYLYY